MGIVMGGRLNYYLINYQFHTHPSLYKFTQHFLELVRNQVPIPGFNMSTDIPKIEAGNLFNVNGLVAVITGGGSGLGRMMARALAANGALKVFVIGRREESLKETADSIPGGRIVPLVGDVTSKESLQQCVDKVKAEVDSIDVLVANSGISGPPVPTVDSNREPIGIEQLTKNMWNPDPTAVTSTYAVNITGVHFTVAAFLPLLDAANKKRPQPPTEDNFKPRP